MSCLSGPCNVLLQPWSEGFIALVLPKLSEAHSICSGLLSAEEYTKHLDERSTLKSRADGIEDIQLLGSVPEADTNTSGQS